MLRALPILFVASCPFFTSCTSPGSLPPGQGRGVIAFDPAPPPGAQVWQRPVLCDGDTFTLRLGGHIEQPYVVGEVTERGHTLRAGDGHGLKRDRDLGILGEWPASGDEPLHLKTPADTRLHWPLWVGKKWRCEYADRKRDGQATLFEVAYEVEGLDTIVVPAGTFQALRIVRKKSPVVPGEQYLFMTSFSWFAPDVGLDVREVVDGNTFELLEFTRKAPR